jgi:hypothetical protein
VGGEKKDGEKAVEKDRRRANVITFTQNEYIMAYYLACVCVFEELQG